MSEMMLKFALSVLNPPHLATRKLFKLPAAGITFDKVRSAIRTKYAVPDHTSIKNIQYMDEDFEEYLDLDADVLISGVTLFKLKVTFDRGMRSPACPSVPHAMLILFDVWIQVSFISLSVGNAEISSPSSSSGSDVRSDIVVVDNGGSSISDSSSDDDSHPKAGEPVHQASQPEGHSICSFPTSRSTMRLGIHDTNVPVEPFCRRSRINRIASLIRAMQESDTNASISISSNNSGAEVRGLFGALKASNNPRTSAPHFSELTEYFVSTHLYRKQSLGVRDIFFSVYRSAMRLGIYVTYLPIESVSRRCRVNRIASLICPFPFKGPHLWESVIFSFPAFHSAMRLGIYGTYVTVGSF